MEEEGAIIEIDGEHGKVIVRYSEHEAYVDAHVVIAQILFSKGDLVGMVEPPMN